MKVKILGYILISYLLVTFSSGCTMFSKDRIEESDAELQVIKSGMSSLDERFEKLSTSNLKLKRDLSGISQRLGDLSDKIRKLQNLIEEESPHTDTK